MLDASIKSKLINHYNDYYPNFNNIYSPDIYLLDDPLSALDMKVASNLIKTIATHKRLQDKTFIFSTNNPSYIKYADKIIYMDQGRVKFSGSYDEFKISNLYKIYLGEIEEEVQSLVSNPQCEPTLIKGIKTDNPSTSNV